MLIVNEFPDWSVQTSSVAVGHTDDATVAPLVSPAATVTVTSVADVRADDAAPSNPAVTVIGCASELSVTVPGDAVTSKAVSLAAIVNVSEATVTPVNPEAVPVTANVSASSVTASSVTNRPVRFVQALWV